MASNGYRGSSGRVHTKAKALTLISRYVIFSLLSSGKRLQKVACVPTKSVTICRAFFELGFMWRR